MALVVLRDGCLAAADFHGLVMLAADRRAPAEPLQLILRFLLRRRPCGIDLAAGSSHTCAITTRNELVCFGNDDYGQCTAPADLGPVLAVAAGTTHTCAITTRNELLCFGRSDVGQCAGPADLGPS